MSFANSMRQTNMFCTTTVEGKHSESLESKMVQWLPITGNIKSLVSKFCLLIFNFSSRAPSDLSSLESTTDGYSVVMGMVDGNLTVLTIADPKKGQMSEYLKALPSRNKGKNLLAKAGF